MRKTKENPFEPPMATGCSRDERSSVRSLYLVNLSPFLAVMIEVSPTEADVFFSLRGTGLFSILTAKLLFLLLILLPLAIFFVRNGCRAWKYAPTRIVLIAAIVLMKGCFDCACLLHSLQARATHAHGGSIPAYSAPREPSEVIENP